MGTLEKELEKQIRMTKIKKIVLQTVASAGIISVALLAPNAVQMLKLLPRTKRFLNDEKIYINKSRKKLVEEGLLKYNRDGFVELTEFGEKILRRFESKDFKLSKPKRWDGKWRILIFDIKESQRGTRDKVRNTLVGIGFRHLQHSVWVYPYDCEDLITLLKTDFMIGKDLLYIIADKIENDKWLRKEFDLFK